MRAMLFCLSGSMRGQTLAPNANPIVVGTATDCHIRFPDAEDEVAERAFELIEKDGQFRVRSLTDRPLIVNSDEVMESDLTSNDLLRIGCSGPLFRFRPMRDRRGTKTMGQMIADSALFAKDSAQLSRTSRFKAFTSQFVEEAIANSTKSFKVSVFALAVALAAIILGIGIWGYLDRQYEKDQRADLDALETRSAELLADSAKHLETLEAIQEQNRLIEGQVDEAKVHRDGLRRTVDDIRAETKKARAEAMASFTTKAEQENAQIRARSVEMQKLLDEIRRNIVEITATVGAKTEIMRTYSDSVCFIVVAYSLFFEETGEFLCYEVDENGNRTGGSDLGAKGDRVLSLISGSGFLVKDGLVVTNRHVCDPWWEEADPHPLIAHGSMKPYREAFYACFPGTKEPIALSRVACHDEADVAIARLEKVPPGRTPIPLAPKGSRPAPGADALLLGYPLGFEGLLYRVEMATRRKFSRMMPGNHEKAVTVLLNAGAVMPYATSGVLHNDGRGINYDARTTHGGSGGPLFTEERHVVAINTAITNFEGNNLGEPIEHAHELLDSGPLLERTYESKEMSDESVADAIREAAKKAKAAKQAEEADKAREEAAKVPK